MDIHNSTNGGYVTKGNNYEGIDVNNKNKIINNIENDEIIGIQLQKNQIVLHYMTKGVNISNTNTQIGE